jgi:hypothetical protein
LRIVEGFSRRGRRRSKSISYDIDEIADASWREKNRRADPTDLFKQALNLPGDFRGAASDVFAPSPFGRRSG